MTTLNTYYLQFEWDDDNLQVPPFHPGMSKEEYKVKMENYYLNNIDKVLHRLQVL